MRHLIITAALALSACQGTETDNPLADFKHTGCKNHGETALMFAGDTAPSEPLPESTGYDGLYCFSYDYDEAAKLLSIDVYNYPSACGSEFTGASARSREAALTLSLDRASCDVTRCGTCYYDLAFQVTGVELRASHVIELAEAGCEGTAADQEPELLTFATVEQVDRTSGTFCRTLGAPTACESDGDCRADLERCSDAGTCEPLLTF